MSSRFTGIYSGYKACYFDFLSDYDAFIKELMDLRMSYKTKILKKRGMPTQYVVMLIS